MFKEIFFTTLQQMAILFMFMACGFFFAKKKIFDRDVSNILSKLCVNIFVPAISFTTMADLCTVDNLKNDSTILLVGTATLAVTLLIGIFMPKFLSKSRDTRAVYLYALVCPNSGYIGYPVVLALLGEKGLFDFMIWNIPYSIFIYSVAIQILKPNGKISIKGFFTSPVTIGMFLGMICGLTGVTNYIPTINSFASAAGNCMTPVGMILTGLVLGRLEIKSLFDDVRTYIISAFRLILLPLAGVGVLKLLGITGLPAILTVVDLALPAGLNTIVFPEAFHGDSKSGARVVFFTNIVGLITIPVMVALAYLVLNV